LQNIDLFPGNPGFRWRVNIGCDRNFQVSANGRKNLAAFAHANSAKRTYGSSIRFVIGRFENEIDIFIRADLRDFFRHPPDEFLGLDHAWAENKRGTFPTDGDRPDFHWLRLHERENESGKQEKKKKNLACRFLLPVFLINFLLCKIDNGKRGVEPAKEEQGDPMQFQKVKRARIGEKT
jgi:hypothetical protein